MDYKTPSLALSLAVVATGCATQSGMSEQGRDEAIEAVMSAPEAVDSGAGPIPDAAKDLLRPAPLSSGGERPVREPRFDLNADDVNVANLYHGLVKDTPYNVVVHPDIEGSVSLNLKDVSVPEVMEVLREGYGYHYQRTDSSFLILPSSLETQVFSLNYINVDREGVSGTRVSGGEIKSSEEDDSGASDAIEASSLVTESDSALWSEVEQAIEQIIDAPVSGDDEGERAGGSVDSAAHVVTSPASGRVVVRAQPEALEQVEGFLTALQESLNRQVVLEARIVEVTLNDQFEAGIDWSYVGQTSGEESSINLNPGASGFSDGVFDLGLMRGASFNATISALDEQGDVMVLSAPRVSTLNNQKALIKVGTDSFFQTGVDLDTTITDGNAQTTIDPEFRSFFSGISLDVTPNIGDDGRVTLHVRPSVSDVTETPRTVETGSSGEVSFQLASSDVRQSDSIVQAQDGELIVIGGLMEQRSSSEDASVPVLGSGGPFAPLFSRTNDQMEKVELAILLRPTIVGERTWSQTIDQQLENML